MKGFLTFTLVAGVAISTSSIVQAAGVAKGTANISKAPAVTQGASSIGAMGLTLDRSALSRELNRLNELLAPVDGTSETDSSDATVRAKSGVVWSF